MCFAIALVSSFPIPVHIERSRRYTVEVKSRGDRRPGAAAGIPRTVERGGWNLCKNTYRLQLLRSDTRHRQGIRRTRESAPPPARSPTWTSERSTATPLPLPPARPPERSSAHRRTPATCTTGLWACLSHGDAHPCTSAVVFPKAHAPHRRPCSRKLRSCSLVIESECDSGMYILNSTVISS